jgi:hypothetical protein
MTAPPHVRRITYFNRDGKGRWFSTGDALRLGDSTNRLGRTTGVLYEIPGGTLVVTEESPYGRVRAWEQTLDEALQFLTDCCLDPYEPWPQRVQQLIEQRSAARSPPDAGAKHKQPSKKARAIALLSEHPDWSNKKIAAQVPCNAKVLSQDPKFRAARRAVKKLGKAELPRGSKGDEGTMEAYEG